MPLSESISAPSTTRAHRYTAHTLLWNAHGTVLSHGCVARRLPLTFHVWVDRPAVQASLRIASNVIVLWSESEHEKSTCWCNIWKKKSRFGPRVGDDSPLAQASIARLQGVGNQYLQKSDKASILLSAIECIRDLRVSEGCVDMHSVVIPVTSWPVIWFSGIRRNVGHWPSRATAAPFTTQTSTFDADNAI